MPPMRSGRSAVLIAEEGTYAHTDGRQQAGDAANQAGGGQDIDLHGGKADADGEASMLVATASGSIALAGSHRPAFRRRRSFLAPC